MDITASLFGTAAAPAMAVSAATAATPADANAFAAALGQATLPEAGFGAPPVAGQIAGAAVPVELTGAPAPGVVVASAEPGPLQPVPEEFGPEPWMTQAPQPGRPGKLPRPTAANQPAPIAPALPEPVAAAPIAPVPGPAAEKPALVAEFASLPAPAPELAPEPAADPPVTAIVALAASLPEPVARAVPPAADAELSLDRPAEAEAAPKLDPRLTKAADAPDFIGNAATAADPVEPVVTRAEAPARADAPVRAEALSAPVPAPAPAAAPVQQAAALAPPVAAAPVAPAVPPPPVRASLATGFGERIGLAIARRLGEGGDEMTVRLEPAELGRIQVKLSFDEQGSLRAVLSAETAAVIDALRRDSADLARALGDAGVRTDAQSFRFDRGGAGEQGQSAWARWQAQHGGRDARGDGGAPSDEQSYRPAKRNGRLDLMA